jgi:hypothetical protein
MGAVNRSGKFWLIGGLLCVLCGCAGENADRLVAVSQTHLDAQAAHLEAASRHLDQAHDLLAAEPDPRQAGAALDAGRNELQQAIAVGQSVRQDVEKLGQSDASLQKQINSQRNDWLGPKAKRVRNRLILILILIGIGAALLRFGPLLGGPYGGAAIVAGHVLTIFALPLFRMGWRWVVGAAEWLIGMLEKVGNDALSSAASATSAASQSVSVSGAPHAATGSD